ncbi:MAG: carbohydrate kinase, partial [Muricauda sp.]|nr:carbohydrate kinase [Allomuricauda sp.]
MFWLGYDIGSSSIKAALIRATDGSVLDISQHPKKEMPMISMKQGWAEQDPELWWKHVCSATKELMISNKVARHDIKGIGISYQMHGLVTVDQKLQPIRPSIIWCDSRAVEIGEKLF